MSRARAEQTAQELRDVVSTLVRRLRAEVLAEGMGWPQRSLLRRLDSDGPATTADLARAEQVRPQTMGELVAELEEQKLVARTDDVNDGRRKLVAITEAGRRALVAALPLVRRLAES